MILNDFYGMVMSFAKSSIAICLVLYGKCFEMARWVRICLYKSAFLYADKKY